jgi:peroxiredoxin Q/BCP
VKAAFARAVGGALHAALAPPLWAVGDRLPAWTLQAAGGAWHRSDDGPYVLVVYPADATPGCTLQLQAWQRAQGAARAAGVRVLGLNPAPLPRHQAFAESCGLELPLLSDPGGQVTRQLRCAWPSGIGTRPVRTVYAVDRSGAVRFAERGAPDPARVLAAIG